MSPISRRDLLRGGVFTLLSATALRGDPTGWTTAFGRPGIKPDDPKPARRLGGDGPGGRYTAPFSVTASNVLSEDYFLTDQVLLNSASDEIKPFARADGTVEALVLAGGSVAHLSRNPAVTSGWQYTVLSNDSLGEVYDVEVITGPDGTVYALMLNDATSTPFYVWAMLNPTGGGWEFPPGTWDTLDTANGLGPLQSGTDQDQNPYFYAFYNSTGAIGSFLLWQPVLSTEYTTNQSLVGLDIIDAQLLWNPSYSTASPAGGVVARNSKNQALWYVQTGPTSFDRYSTFLGPAARVLWTSWSARSSSTDPAFAIQDDQGNVIYNDNNLVEPIMFTATAALTPDQISVWYRDNFVSFAFLEGATLNTAAEFGVPADDLVDFTPPIPIADGLTRARGLPTDPQQATLFVVDDDLTLSVLSKDPTLGTWTSTPVHQASATVQELTTWRTQLTVIDANGVRVPDTPVQITPDRAIGIWQASGNTLLDPQHPATLTTDDFGRVTFATPAVELDTAILTARIVLDGAASDTPLTVTPDGDVHAFLAGTAPLNYLGTLNGSALLAAQGPTNQPLFPVLAGLSGDAKSNAAEAVAAAVTQCMRAGQGVQPGANDPKSFQLDLSGSAPSYRSSKSATALRRVGSPTDWWDAAKNDAESVFHGIRHGLITVASCTASYAEDVEKWTVNLAISIGEDISGVVSYVITDAKTALHAICGFFQALGADLDATYAWLRHNVSDILRATGANAAVVEGWLGQVPAVVNSRLTEYENLANGYFTSLTDEVNAAIDGVLVDLGDQPTLGSPGSPPPKPVGGHDFAEFVHDVTTNWLLDKLMSWFTGETAVTRDPDFQAVVTDLLAAIADAEAFATDIYNLLWEAFHLDLGSAESFAEYGVGSLLETIKKAVDDLLAFADAVVDALIDAMKLVMDKLGDLLSHEVDAIPLVGELFSTFGIDPNTRVDHLVAMVLMFPATLANAALHQDAAAPLFPGVTAAGTVSASANGDWGPGLRITASIGQTIWAVADTVADCYKSNKEDPPALISWIDIVAPIVLTVLQWPGAARPDGTTPPPFTTDIDTSARDYGLPIPLWLAGFVQPASAAFGKKVPNKSPQVKDGWDDRSGQWLIMLAAIASTIAGSIYNFDNKLSSGTKAAGILANISNIIAPFRLPENVDATEGISLAVKLIVDLGGNLGAAGAMWSDVL